MKMNACPNRMAVNFSAEVFVLVPDRHRKPQQQRDNPDYDQHRPQTKSEPAAAGSGHGEMSFEGFKGVRSLYKSIGPRYNSAMPRRQRVCPPGQVFPVRNRAVARLTLFEKPEDYDALLRVLDETWEITRLPILAMVVMPNHWHFGPKKET
jgi:hypothetical protein